MKYQIQVFDKTFKRILVEVQQQETLMQALGRRGIYFGANCGGQGRCRQCEVLVDGLRKKACKTYIRKECKVVLPFAIEETVTAVLPEVLQYKKPNTDGSYYLIADVGTTTIGAALVEDTKQVAAQEGSSNSQRMYGADVATRILYASVPEQLQVLKKCLYGDLENMLGDMLAKTGLTPEHVKAIYLNGNPTMLHIANGLSPESIGVYPFSPAVKVACVHKERLFGTKEYEVHTFSCASGYIGPDVLLGAFSYGMNKKKAPCLYLDLGTNGEMLLSGEKGIFSTSVAAGPAFEQAMHGAEIFHCLNELFVTNKMDGHGTLMEPYFSSGVSYHGKYITQQDIREIQLAKAAVRAGIELLCKKYGCALEEISKVYLAGGFGFYLDSEDAIALSMFPVQFKNKVEVVGNASLTGAIQYFKNTGHYDEFVKQVINIDLALEPKFHEVYTNYMEF